MAKAAETCRTCKYATLVMDPADKRAATQCRRYPPVFVAGETRTTQPSVWSDGWCGEWSKR